VLARVGNREADLSAQLLDRALAVSEDIYDPGPPATRHGARDARELNQQLRLGGSITHWKGVWRLARLLSRIQLIS
jgi:hypothetical protein